MLYRLNVHIPVSGEEDAVVERLRAALEAEEGVELGEIHVHDGEDGERVAHVESTLEAPSAYHAVHVSGADLYKRLLRGMGMEDRSITIRAERAA